MEANELRIGNWIEKFTVLGDSIGFCKVEAKDFLAMSNHPEWQNPIPLSDEILLKCGFVNDGGDWKIRIYGEDNRFYTGWFVLFISYDYKTYSRKYVVPMGDYRNETEADIKYIHQLQNLYFALTGRELEVNL